MLHICELSSLVNCRENLSQHENTGAVPVVSLTLTQTDDKDTTILSTKR